LPASFPLVLGIAFKRSIASSPLPPFFHKEDSLSRPPTFPVSFLLLTPRFAVHLNLEQPDVEMIFPFHHSFSPAFSFPLAEPISFQMFPPQVQANMA